MVFLVENNGKKIGIMGGTFNPIHFGHLMVAEDARRYCKLDEVIFIPSGNSYMKETDEIIEGPKRLSMTELAISHNPSFSCSDIEIKRGGNTYTYETLIRLREIYPYAELYFIMGADNLFHIAKWKNADMVMKNCKIIAASRGEKSIDELQMQADWLKETYHAYIILLPERKMDISSTEIREKVFQNESIRYLTPDNVCDYIYKHKLYTK